MRHHYTVDSFDEQVTRECVLYTPRGSEKCNCYILTTHPASEKGHVSRDFNEWDDEMMEDFLQKMARHLKIEESPPRYQWEKIGWDNPNFGLRGRAVLRRV